MIFSLFITSLTTAFNLSSNSPLYFAPAIKALISRAITFLFCKDFGTSFLIILCAKASTIAVFPTPGSPKSIGLFLVLRIKICIKRSISSSLPITGSSLPSLAFKVKSIPNLFKLSKVSSLVLLSILRPALRLSSSF